MGTDPSGACPACLPHLLDVGRRLSSWLKGGVYPTQVTEWAGPPPKRHPHGPAAVCLIGPVLHR